MDKRDITLMIEEIRSAWDKDYPQTAISKFREASEQFIKDSDYKGLLVFFEQCLPMVDMLNGELLSILEQAEDAISALGDNAMKALFFMVVARTFRRNYQWDEVNSLSKAAMSNPKELDIPIKDFEWFVGNVEPQIIYGKDNQPIFGDNLLSYIALHTRQFGLLVNYFEQTNNQDAACYAKYLDIEEDYYNGEERLWNLVEQHIDTPVSLYAWGSIIEKYLLGSNCYKSIEERNTTVSKVINQLQAYMNQFPRWPNIGMARELLEKFAEPEIKVQMDKTVILPNRPCTLSIECKNIGHVTLFVFRTSIENRNGHHEIHSEVVEKSFESTPVLQKEYDFKLCDKHHWLSNSIEFGSLSPGLYKIIIKAADKICFAEMIQVSQLCLLVEPLPKDKKRIAVLDAETGLPVPNAKVHVRSENKVGKYKTIKCDEKGEIIWDSSNTDFTLYPFLEDDQWSETVSLWEWNSYKYNKMESIKTGDVLTDRSIYRPGQTVHITVVRYNVNESNQVKTVQQESMGITLTKEYERDVIWKKTIKTDEYGIAQTDFNIPEDIEPGTYTLRSGGRPSTNIEIEEYKRPTFKVTLEPYTQPYKIGDTITIKGKATSFSGVPIANAKVKYRTYAEMSMWFYRLSLYWEMSRYTYRSLEECVSNGEAITDEQGNFEIEVSLEVDPDNKRNLKDKPLFLDVTAYVDVVDITGETQSDSITLPLSNRDWILFVDMDYKIEKSDGLVFTPAVRNSIGNIHKCEVRYHIDNDTWCTAVSGEKVHLYDVPTGKHVLKVEYGDEKFEREFIIFDSNSSIAPCEIECWEYQSSKVFPEDGSPVILQVGNSNPDTYILYDIFSGDHLIESGAVKTESGMIRRVLHYDKTFGNGILINFAWVRNQEVQNCSMTIKKPTPKLELIHKWVSWQDEYTPGGHVKWIARITKADGQFIPTNTIAVVYDKTLDMLHPHSWDNFGPRLDWNVPDTEWEHYHLHPLDRHWRESVSPFDDAVYESNSICCCPSPCSGGHKRGFYNRMDFGGCDEEKGVRSNFSETAFYASNIRTNDNGELEIEFDLPDTLTTWKLMMISCTQDLHWCYVEKEFISKKSLMLTSNMPRFLRTGDNSTISAKVTNLSEKAVCAQVVMEILHAGARDIVFSESKTVNIDSGSTVATSFSFVPEEDVENFICRIYANGGTCRDGEERTIPVLSHKAKVTVTHVFDQCGQSLYQVKPQEMFPNDTSCHQLSLDYTNNALWLAVKAMKGMVKYDKENAVSVMAALYSTLITKHLKEQVIREPKDIKLDEEVERMTKTLGKLQMSDGGFCWYKGIPSSIYITTEVLMHFARLSAIISLPPKVKDMLEDGFSFVDKDMKKTIKKLKEAEKDGLVVGIPSFTMLQHLYNSAIYGRTISKGIRDDFNYLVKLMLRDVHRQTIYEKAMSAVILNYIGKRELALEYVESLCQYTEKFENRGRSFKTPRATYSWYSYKIPTHVAAMEAIARICHDRQQILIEMQKWLLNEKRTQVWETPIDSVNAVYALLQGNVDVLHEEMKTTILIDKEKLDVESVGKEGHVQVELDPKAHLITFEKESKGMAWGAVYANFLQLLSDVESNGSGMSIKREIISDKEELHVGDRITVRLTFKCDRNYDMVEIVDSKAACMEPVNQFSWCDSFKHVAPHDTKFVYSYYGLAEGTYSIEMEFWLDRPGTYEIGLATICCAYAPEFRATCPSQKLIVLP